jgi:hypothetical protein
VGAGVRVSAFVWGARKACRLPCTPRGFLDGQSTLSSEERSWWGDPAASAQRVRFVGRFAQDVHPTVSSIDAIPSSGEVVRAKPFRELVDGVESASIDLSPRGHVTTAGLGTVVVDTGIDEPRQVEVRFAWGESTKLSHR